MQIFQEMSGSADTREIWCGDFNAHNVLLGIDHTDTDGVEDSEKWWKN